MDANRYLLDTNVISELVKPEPNPGVISFLSSVEQSYLSIITLHEINYGLGLLPQGKRRTVLEAKVTELLTNYQDLIIPIQYPEADQAAKFRVLAKKQGLTIHLADSLIAGTAHAHSLILATRNTSDFAGVDIQLINPWD